MLRSLLAALLVAITVPAAGAPPAAAPPPSPASASVLRVFTLKHRRADDALLLVRPLLSDQGSVLLQPRLNTLTVRDTPQAVERAARALSAWDLPPRALSISVSLLKATTDGPAPQEPVSEEIKAVGARLKKLFNFTGYSRLDAVVVQGVEGDSISYVLGGDYRLEFVLDPSGDDAFVRLKGLTLSRLRRDASGREVARDIARTSLNIPMGEPFVLGVGRDEAASGALFLVLVASPRGAGPGLSGVR